MKVIVKDGGQGMLLPSKQRVPHTDFHSAYQKWVGRETTSSMFSLEVNRGLRLVVSLTFLLTFISPEKTLGN